MANLLDEASILLSATAYNNGSMLAVKPENGDGDFTFSRNSAATRVNAQGLVENVQILSSDLVSNGDFSQEGVQEVSNGSFSQEGSELITNGDFATDTAWAKGTGWSISGGSANCDGAGNGNYLSQTSNSTLVLGKTYKVNFDVTRTSGTILLMLASSSPTTNTSGNIITGGSKEFYITISTLTDQNIYFRSNSFNGSIDNVSVKEVGQDWTLGSGWSIGEDKAIYTGTANANLSQNNVLASGKKYKLQYTVISSTLVGGIVKISGTTSVAQEILSQATGTHSLIFIADGSSPTNLDIRIVVNTSGQFDITNISVKEVGQNWTVSSDSFISQGFANIVSSGAYQYILQSAILIVGKKYKIQYTILSGSTGDLKLGTSFGVVPITSTVGTHSIIATALITDLYIERETVCDVNITNISVIEITDDTNLPRINYEGFSYQDSLGSEEVTNGDFATDSNWSKGSAWTISGGTANFDDTATSGLSQNMTFVSGKTYKISFEVISGTASIGFYSSNGATAYIGYQVYAIGTHNLNFLHSTGANLGIFGNKFAGTAFSIDNVSVKEFLGQEVVPDSGCGSWLMEGQSTNLIPYSEDFTQWSQQGVSTVSNSAISPDGTLNADKITATTTDPAPFIFTNVTATEHTFSFYYKGEANSIGKQARVLFWYIGTATGTTTSINFTLTEDWQRFEGKTTPTGAGTLAVRFDFPANEAVVGDYGYLWGAQLEQSSYATSYIPTQGAASTRLRDISNNSGNADLINSEEGTLYFEGSALANDGTSRRITISDGTYLNRLFLAYTSTSNELIAVSISNNVTSVIISKSINVLQINKIAFKYKENDFALWVNGVKLGVDTSANTPIGINTLRFEDWNGTNTFYGKNKAIAVFKTALTDEQLTLLTTI